MPPRFAPEDQELLRAFIETKTKVEQTEEWLNVERRVEDMERRLDSIGKPKIKEPLTKRAH